MSWGGWGKWAASLAETAAAQVAETARASAATLQEAAAKVLAEEGGGGASKPATGNGAALLPWESSPEQPWVGRYADDIRTAVLRLSRDARFVANEPPAEVGFIYSFNAAVAAKLLHADPTLEALRFKVVPARVKEDQFWRNYFYAVSVILDSFRMRADADPQDDHVPEAAGAGSGAGAGGGSGAGAGAARGASAGVAELDADAEAGAPSSPSVAPDAGDGAGAAVDGDANVDMAGVDVDDADFEDALQQALDMEDVGDSNSGGAGGVDGGSAGGGSGDAGDGADMDPDDAAALMGMMGELSLDEFGVAADDDVGDVDPDWEAQIRAELGLHDDEEEGGSAPSAAAASGGPHPEPTQQRVDGVATGGDAAANGASATAGAALPSSGTSAGQVSQDSRGSWELVR